MPPEKKPVRAAATTDCSSPMALLFALHFAATWVLVGLIWTIQVVHYPLFAEVGPERFRHYHERHMALVGRLVVPLMLAEAASAVGLFLLGERTTPFWISLAGLAVVWGSTGLLQVPLHLRLSQGHDDSAIRRLVLTNLWRTAGWTVRGLCLSALVFYRVNPASAPSSPTSPPASESGTLTGHR
jgi:hypothetical protein